MTREQAIDSLGYGMFANNSELVHDIFNYFEKEIKNLDVAIKIYEGALESSSIKQALFEQRNAELEQRVKELEEPKMCEGCKHRNHLADETEPCNSCFIKIGYGNNYEPK